MFEIVANSLKIMEINYNDIPLGSKIEELKIDMIKSFVKNLKMTATVPINSLDSFLINKFVEINFNVNISFMVGGIFQVPITINTTKTIYVKIVE
jgi:hypothetical protein